MRRLVFLGLGTKSGARSFATFRPAGGFVQQRWSGVRVDGTTEELPDEDDELAEQARKTDSSDDEEEEQVDDVGNEEPNADAGADVKNRRRYYTNEVPGFTINGLNRFHAHQLRRDESWLRSALLERPNSRFLAFSRLRPMVEHRTPPTHLGPILAWQEREQVLPVITHPKSSVVFLGQSLRATNSELSIQEQLGDESNQVRTSFEEPRSMVPHLPPWEGGVVAQARSMLDWNKRTGYCSSCGSTTSPMEGGYVRKCNDDKHEDCGVDHYPRTDPCIITMVVSSNKDKCLLGRKSSWPNGRYSLLAGFMEPGETIEAAVLREVYEEAGLLLDYDKVAYKLSQPWPFPSSLMIGCIATMSEAEIQRQKVTVDHHELDEARWFDVKEVAAMLARSSREGGLTEGQLHLPPPLTISHHLVKLWLHERKSKRK